MVFILAGNSDIGAQVKNQLGYLICLDQQHWQILMFFLKIRPVFLFTCATYKATILSIYHDEREEWDRTRGVEREIGKGVLYIGGNFPLPQCSFFRGQLKICCECV